MFRIHYFIFVTLLVLVLVARVFLYFHFHKEVKLPKNQPVHFEATIKLDPRISDGGQVISIADAKIYTDLYPRVTMGDRISVEGEADDRGRMFGAKVQKVGQKRGFFVYLIKLRREISDKIFAMLPQDEATLVVGSVLGVDQINASFRDKLIKTGTIHVVVVSGQNLMIVVGVLASLINYIGRRKTRVLTLALVFFYALLTGFEPPVVRATLMVLFTTMALFFGREIRPVWGLFLAAFVIIFIWPAAISEVSFQLTFAATLGIVTLGQRLSRSNVGPARLYPTPTSSLDTNPDTEPKMSPDAAAQSNVPAAFDAAGARAGTPRPSPTSKFLNLLAVPLSAYLFTAPTILYYFGQVSLISPLVNVLVVEAVAPIMTLGFLIAISALIFTPIAQTLAFLAFVPAFYFSQVVRFSASLPVGMLSLGKNSLVFVIAFYILVFSLIWLFSYKDK